MTRIAFFGPLPPSKTGIADYDEALLPLLRHDFDIDVFLQEKPSDAEGFSHAEFFSKNKKSPYDLALYQMGNSRFHEYMYGYLFQNPGAVIFHDYCLLHSRSEMLLKKKLFIEYRAELAAIYPQQADQIANAVYSSAAGDLLFYQFPLFELVLRSSLAAAAHTDVAVTKLGGTDTPVIKIPHLQLKGGNRTAEHLHPGKFMIASFGYVTNAKRISTLLEVVADISKQYSNVVCVLVGDVEDRIGLNHQIETLRLKDQVIVTGHVEMATFLEWMGRADVIVNLRFPSAGEMSGTLIRALASAKPVILSRLPELQEIPENAVLRVRPDQEKKDLHNALNAIINQENLRKSLSTSAKDYIAKHHSSEQVKGQYCKLIEAALERKKHFRGISLPAHLQSGEEILRDYLKQGAINGAPTALEWLVGGRFIAPWKPL